MALGAAGPFNVPIYYPTSTVNGAVTRLLPFTLFHSLHGPTPKPVSLC
uniref:Uncharacterized protein n=1 Tax=Arundo donax TaxID=35708 RepID=A0A0A9HPK8_ARUDO